MKSSILIIIYLSISTISIVYAQSVANNVKLDSKEVKCLVCQKSILELNKAIKSLDPNKKVDVGGHRLDADGNYKHKVVPQAKSELVLSDIIEQVCDKMDNYVRALWKGNGTLTLLNMMGDDGKMNPAWGDVDFIQDDDLNKSLKYYCEEIMSEYEESIIKLYQDEETGDLSRKFCLYKSRICAPKMSHKEL